MIWRAFEMEEKLMALAIEADGTVSFAKHSFSLQDIIGVRAVSSHVVEVAQCVESRSECFGGKMARNLEHRQIKVQEDAETIVGELRSALRARWPGAPGRVLVIVNPTSGVRGANVWLRLIVDGRLAKRCGCWILACGPYSNLQRSMSISW